TRCLMNCGWSLSTSVILFGLIGEVFTAAADPLDVWQWRNPLPQGNALRGIAYGNGTVVAVGDNGTILSSGNGDSWTLETSGSLAELEGVTSGSDLFVTVGRDGTIL